MERVGKKRIHSSHNTKPNQHHDWQRGWDCRTRLPGVLFREDLNFIWSTTRNFILSTVYILPCYPDRIKGVGQVADVIVGVPLALLRRRSAARQRNIISYSSHRGDSYCVVPRASPHYFSFGNYDSHIRVITALANPLEIPFTFTNTHHPLQHYHLSFSTKKDCIFPCNTVLNLDVAPRLPVRHTTIT
jgi:hypothetical protein